MSLLTLAVLDNQLYARPILKDYSRHHLPRLFYDHTGNIPRIEYQNSVLAHHSPAATFFQRLLHDC